MSDHSLSSTVSPSRAREYGILLSWAMLYVVIAGAVQFILVSAPVDADTAYHAAVGRLIREHGILRSFPWTPFSWLSDHYADKELLFHLTFVPVSGLDWITASKLVGTLFGGLLLFALFFILRAEKVPFAGLWALLPLITSDVFLYRFSLVRPHLLSITLALLIIWAALRGRYFLLAAVSAAYPWSYVAFWQVPVILLSLVESARFLAGNRIRWQPAAVSAAAILVAWSLHPNALNLLKLNWIHMVDILMVNAWQSKGGIELGQEFLPFSGKQWLQWLLAASGMTMTALIIGWRERKKDILILSFALVALAFAVLTLRTARFAEYFIPFAAASMALASPTFHRKWIIALVFCAVLFTSAKPLSETARGIGERADTLPPQLASWFQERVPPGSQVFTTDWEQTGTLMLALPDRKFVVALDPTLFLIEDPERYRLWYDIPRHPYPGMAETIRQRFGARFVISHLEERFSEFYFRLSSEPGVQAILLSDNNWVAFDLAPSTP